MFCSKCGRQIPDGTVCPCQQQQAAPANNFAQPQNNFSQPHGNFNQPQNNFSQPQPGYMPPQPGYVQTPAKPLPIALSKVITVGIILLTFFLHFIPWYKFDAYKVKSFGPYFGMSGSTLWYTSPLMGIAMVFMVIAIIAFCVFLLATVIDFRKYFRFITFDVYKAAGYLFHIAIIAALLFGFIGTFVISETAGGAEAAKYYKINAGWIVTLIFTLISTLNFVIPNILKDLLKENY